MRQELFNFFSKDVYLTFLDLPSSLYINIQILFINIQNIWLDFNILIFITKNLEEVDPSHFQNILLGILAIFIPILLVFLTKIYSKDLAINNDFLSFEAIKHQLLSVKEVFIASSIYLSIFAIYNLLHVLLQCIVIVISLFILSFLAKVFFRVLNFSEDSLPQYELKFLEKLSVNKDFLILYKAYNSLWRRKKVTWINEEKFHTIFIKHVNIAIEQPNNLKRNARILIDIYRDNYDKRDKEMLRGQLIKFFQWANNSIVDEYLRDFYKKIFLNTSLYLSVYALQDYIDSFQSKESSEKPCKFILSIFFPIFFKNKISPNTQHETLGSFSQSWQIKHTKQAFLPEYVYKLFFNEFCKWATSHENKNIENTRNLFPNIDTILFRSFLRYYKIEQGDTTTDALSKEYQINQPFISRTIYNNTGTTEESLGSFISRKEKQNKEYTIDIITTYYDLNSNRLSDIKEIVSNIKTDEYKERKKQLLELIELLISSNNS